MFIGDGAVKSVRIGESLRPGTLTNADHSVLFRMKNTALFAHGLRIGDGGTEESVPLQSSVKASPVIAYYQCEEDTTGSACCVACPRDRIFFHRHTSTLRAGIRSTICRSCLRACNVKWLSSFRPSNGPMSWVDPANLIPLSMG